MTKDRPVTIGTLLFFFVLFDCIATPILLFVAFITLPYKIYVILTRKMDPELKLGVTVQAPAGGKSKGDLLFVHGWPDTGSVWKP